MSFHTTAVRVLPLAATLFVLSACSDLSQPDQVQRRYGSIVVDGTVQSDTEVNAVATGIFFRSVTAAVPSSITSQNDQCTVTLIDTTTVETFGVDKAGDALAMQVGTEAIELAYVPMNFRYDSPQFTYTAGTTAQLTVPGNGDIFPSSTVSVLLAEPLIAPPVTISSTQPLTVNWNAASGNTSAVIMSLRYASPGNAGYGNQQIVCQMKDDGQTVLPASSLTAFFNSPPMHRSLTLTRFRTNEVNVDDKTLLHINSQITVPVVLQ